MSLWVYSSQICYECNSFSYKSLILLWILLNISLQWFAAAMKSLLNTHTKQSCMASKEKAPELTYFIIVSSTYKPNNHSLSSLFLQNNHKHTWMPEVIYPSLVLFHFIYGFSGSQQNEGRKKVKLIKRSNISHPGTIQHIVNSRRCHIFTIKMICPHSFPPAGFVYAILAR